MQVDVAYLRPQLRRLTGGSSAAMVESLLEEVRYGLMTIVRAYVF